MNEKINEDMKGLKRTLLVTFLGSETAEPVAISYIFDTEGQQEKIAEIKANYPIDKVCGFK
jgi:hypothetical protein